MARIVSSALSIAAAKTWCMTAGSSPVTYNGR
jgi:hypothetical protein